MMTNLEAGVAMGLGGAAVAGLAAGGGAYAALWPGSQIFGPTLIAPRRPGELALTFDDGPNPLWTPRLLDMLAGHGIRATFFLIGSYAAREPALVRRMVAEGHCVGNHSWSHPNLALTTASRIQNELALTQQTLQQITGMAVTLFRPPFGARRPAVLRIAAELGMRTVLWNAMTDDWKEPSADLIARRLSVKIDSVTRQGRAANIVLHDGSHQEQAARRGPSMEAADWLANHYNKIAPRSITSPFVTVDFWDGEIPRQ